MDYIRAIERQQIREDIPQVRVADNVKVSVLSVPSRFTAPRSPSSRSFVMVAFVAPSCTTSATRWVRLLASPRSAKKIAASVHSFGHKGHLRVALLFI